MQQSEPDSEVIQLSPELSGLTIAVRGSPSRAAEFVRGLILSLLALLAGLVCLQLRISGQDRVRRAWTAVQQLEREGLVSQQDSCNRVGQQVLVCVALQPGSQACCVYNLQGFLRSSWTCCRQ